jgi:hypothetical protein
MNFFRIVLLILIFVIPTQLLSIDITHYKNEFAEISGIYDSEEFGILFSNSTGLYSLDESTGNISPIPTEGKINIFDFNRFFVYIDEIYCYREEGLLYRIRGGKLERVTEKDVVAHLVYDGKLYLLKRFEPRVEVFEGDSSSTFHLGDNGGQHMFAYLVEVNGNIYASLSLNWTGKRFLLQILDDRVVKIRDNFEISGNIYNIDGELWFSTFSTTYKYIDGILTPIGESYVFDEGSVYDLAYKNGKIFGFNSKGLFMTDAETKENKYFLEFYISSPDPKMIKYDEENMYFFLNGELYFYNFDSDEFGIFPRNDDEPIGTFELGSNGKIILAKNERIEINDGTTAVFKNKNGLYSNRFSGITYDRFNDRFIVAGVAGSNYILQFIDGDEFETMIIDSLEFYNSYGSIPDIDVIADDKGHYYICNSRYLGYWDGTTWNRISFLKYPQDENHPPFERFQLLLLDSSGYVWISRYKREYSSKFNMDITYSSVGKMQNGVYENLYTYDRTEGLVRYNEGICTKDGVVVLSSYGKEICYDCGSGNNLIIPEDGNQHPALNTSRTLSSDRNGDLVISYHECNLRDDDYGLVFHYGGISTFDGKNWDHTKYKSVVDLNRVFTNYSRVVYDSEWVNYIISSGKIIKLNDNGKNEAFVSEDFDLPMMRVALKNNTVWITTVDNGLFRVELPFETSVDEDDDNIRFLTNDIIYDGTLELQLDINEYQIYDLRGQMIAHGGEEKIIDVNELSVGCYLLILETSNGVVAKKFVIRK